MTSLGIGLFVMLAVVALVGWARRVIRLLTDIREELRAGKQSGAKIGLSDFMRANELRGK